MRTTVTTTDKAEQTAIANAAVLANDIGYIKRDIGEIKDSLKALPGLYLTQKEYNEHLVEEEKRFTAIERKDSIQKYLWPTISSALAVVLSLLIINFLQHVR